MTAPTDRLAAEPRVLSAARPFDPARDPLPPPLRTGRRLTILDITKYFGPTTGGIRTYLLDKARYVAAHPGLAQLLLVPGPDGQLGDDGNLRCYRVRGPEIPLDRNYRFLLDRAAVRRVLAHERPDLIEVGSPWLVPWVVRRAARDLGIPTAWFYHTHFPAIIAPPGSGTPAWRRAAGRAAWAYVRRLASAHRAVLVASDGVARALEQHGVRNVHRITLGVDLAHFTPARRAEREAVLARHGLPDGPLALYLGRFTEEKRLEVVIDAWRAVGREAGATLVLVGTGPREARLRARAQGLAVRWLPFERDRSRVADLLAAADLYLAPGPAETFGLSALEALASGTPVLSVDVGGVADRVRTSGVGACYPVDDAAACAGQAVRLLGQDRAGQAAAARAWAEMHHAQAAAFDRLFATYETLVAPGA